MGDSNLHERLLDAAEHGSSRMEGGRSRENYKEFLSVDDMLVKHVGEFGPAQFWHFVLVSLAWTLEALHTMTMIFGDRVPEWRCVEQGPSGNSTGSCTPTSALCELDLGTWEWVGGKSSSTVSEWNLICGEEYKVGLAGSLFFIGALLGAGMYGGLSDSLLGRKGSLALCCLTTVTMGLLTAMVPNYWWYAAARFLTGLNTSGIGLCAFVLGTEVVGPNRRGSVGMSAFYFFSLGIMILPFLDIFSTTWRELYFITALPGAVYCMAVLPFIWESPRWYLVKGRGEDAMKVLRAFAKRNKKVVPEGVCLIAQAPEDEENRPQPPSTVPKDLNGGAMSPVTNGHHISIRRDSGASLLINAISPEEEKVDYSGNLMDVFRYGETRMRMILMVFIWFFIGVCYYGISLNVVNLGFNLHVSVFLNGLVELPAYTITAILLGRLGRKFMLVTGLLTAGFCCLGGSFAFTSMPDATVGSKSFDLSALWTVSDTVNEMGMLRLFCGIIGIFGMAGAYNLVYIYTIELFPTVVRNAALGLATQAGSIGSVVAPIIAVIGRTNAYLPFVIFGCMSLVGGALATRLPETKDISLQETMKGMERTESVKVAAAETPSRGQ